MLAAAAYLANAAQTALLLPLWALSGVVALVYAMSKGLSKMPRDVRNFRIRLAAGWYITTGVLLTAAVIGEAVLSSSLAVAVDAMLIVLFFTITIAVARVVAKLDAARRQGMPAKPASGKVTLIMIAALSSSIIVTLVEVVFLRRR